MARRSYRLGKRAESQQDTRRRITEAAVELHGTVGPARTTVADIARKAGVQRLTVYTHFPDQTSLFSACTTHWFGLHPSPDPDTWLAEPSPAERLTHALSAVYAYYEANQQMFANWLRDAQLLPELQPFAESGYFGFIRRVRDSTLSDLDLSGREKDVRAAFLVALHFETWRTLCLREDMYAETAAALMARLTLRAAQA